MGGGPRTNAWEMKLPNVVLRISVKLEVGSQEVVLILDIQGDDGGI